MDRKLLLALASGGTLAAAVAIACSGTTSTDAIAPITGVILRAETLTAGRGCGTSPPQLYRYVALAYGYDGVTPPSDPKAFSVPVASNVFDCFTDGAFVALPITNGSVRYRIELYLYVEPAYRRSAATLDTISGPFDATLGATLRSKTSPTWTTTCVATQQDLVEVLASCDPIVTAEAGASAIQVATTAFARADGGTIACSPSGPVGEDAGTDAGDDGGDGGDAGDAGAPVLPVVSFRTVRVRPRIGSNVVGDTVDLACPQTFILSPATALTPYTFDIGLLDSMGKEVGRTTCSATTEPGASVTATCAPLL